MEACLQHIEGMNSNFWLYIFWRDDEKRTSNYFLPWNIWKLFNFQQTQNLWQILSQFPIIISKWIHHLIIILPRGTKQNGISRRSNNSQQKCLSYEMCLQCICSLVLKVNKLDVLFLSWNLNVTLLVLGPSVLVLTVTVFIPSLLITVLMHISIRHHHGNYWGDCTKLSPSEIM